MSLPLEHFLSNAKLLNESGNYRELVELLFKSSGDILVKNLQQLDTVMESLNMQNHSIIILAVLLVKIKSHNVANANTNESESGEPCSSAAAAAATTTSQPATSSTAARRVNPNDAEILYSQIEEYINGCDPVQAKYCADAFADLCRQIRILLIENQMPERGINLLATAIKIVQLIDSQLTHIHADLCLLSIVAMNFKVALEFLDIDVTEISNQEGSQFEPINFLLYYYYGGVIYTAVKNYEQAAYFYEAVICLPSMVILPVTLEAYKKLILVSLILNGKMPAISKFCFMKMKCYFKSLCPIYLDLGVAYETNSTKDLEEYVEKNKETFEVDKNYGLIKEVVKSLYKKNIQRLTKTFMTLSLHDLASRVKLNGPGEAERYLTDMIQNGEIFARINSIEETVDFEDSPENFDTPEMLCKLEENMKKCIELNKTLKKIESEIMVNPSFINKVNKNESDDDLLLAGPSGTSQLSPEINENRFTSWPK